MSYIEIQPTFSKTSAIWDLIAQWLERLTGDQKVVGSSPACWANNTVMACDIFTRVIEMIYICNICVSGQITYRFNAN